MGSGLVERTVTPIIGNRRRAGRRKRRKVRFVVIGGELITFGLDFGQTLIAETFGADSCIACT